MRFRLMEKDAVGNRTGAHYMGPVKLGKFSKVVRPGEIIESDKPLDEVYRNKFERLHDPTPEPSETKPKRSRK